MKYKLYVATVVIIRKRDLQEMPAWADVSAANPGFNNSIMTTEWTTRGNAERWAKNYEEDLRCKDNPEKFKEPAVVQVSSRVTEFLIDSDELYEHVPTFEVEAEVTITKRIVKEVSGELCKHLGYDADEEGARDALEELFSQGDLDNDIEDGCDWEREIDVLCSVEA